MLILLQKSFVTLIINITRIEHCIVRVLFVFLYRKLYGYTRINNHLVKSTYSITMEYVLYHRGSLVIVFSLCRSKFSFSILHICTDHLIIILVVLEDVLFLPRLLFVQFRSSSQIRPHILSQGLLCIFNAHCTTQALRFMGPMAT